MKAKTTLVMVPCFAGAPWDLNQMTQLKDWPMQTMRLPDYTKDLEGLADYVSDQVKNLDEYILVGDSFGAVISMAFATRKPRGLKALVLSGGFAKNPITSPILKLLAAMAPFFPGLFYRTFTLRGHAANLASRFDAEGKNPWSTKKTREFFSKETPHKAYVSRIRAVKKADYISELPKIAVPTLILTPEEDRLIGKEAAKIMLSGISQSQEKIIPRTGHMFRFSHPDLYSAYIQTFLNDIEKK